MEYPNIMQVKCCIVLFCNVEVILHYIETYMLNYIIYQPISLIILYSNLVAALYIMQHICFIVLSNNIDAELYFQSNIYEKYIL